MRIGELLRSRTAICYCRPLSLSGAWLIFWIVYGCTCMHIRQPWQWHETHFSTAHVLTDEKMLPSHLHFLYPEHNFSSSWDVQKGDRSQPAPCRNTSVTTVCGGYLEFPENGTNSEFICVPIPWDLYVIWLHLGRLITASNSRRTCSTERTVDCSTTEQISLYDCDILNECFHFSVPNPPCRIITIYI
jgi:hypothetical protein